MVGRLSAPLFAQIELTEWCNHRCGYCSNPFADSRTKKPSIKEINRALDELLDNEVFSIVLTGGEPFTNRPSLHHSLDRLNKEPSEVYVNTNLSLPLTSQDIDKLKSADYMLVSFPSHDEERFNQIVGTKSYKKVLANLEILASEEIPFGINQVVTPTNYGDVSETVDFLREKIGLKEFSASPVIPTCSKVDETYSIQPLQVLELASRLIEIEETTGIKTDMLTFIPPCYFPDNMMHHRLTAHGCSAGRDSAIIGANGEVRRCALLGESYGNIQEEGLKEIWNRMQKFEKPKNKQCGDCMPQEYCSGGCEERANSCGGNDPYIVGLSESRRVNLYKTPEDSTVLTLGRVMHREEGDGRYLIGHGGSYVVGNEALLNFTRGIQDKKFSFGEVKNDLGDTGAKLVTYLFNRGLLKVCNSK
jgi:radical SAM protein with 4Fe4S-binding SPASM domain